MKISWTSLKISIAGAKLSHLVQKDKIWDHGSMAEQARILFYLVHKARAGGNMESLKKHCSGSCFEKIINGKSCHLPESTIIMFPVIRELAIVGVHPGKNNKSDMFCSLIKYNWKETINGFGSIDYNNEFETRWCFIRQGDWWLLNEIKN